MKVSDLMTKKLITCEPNDTVNTVLSTMEKNRINQMPVVKDRVLQGIVELKSIILRNIDVTTTKAGVFMTNAPTIGSDQDAEQAVTLLLESGTRAVLVLEKGRLAGIVSETDIIKNFSDRLKNKKIKDVMTPCEYITKDETIASAENFMLEKHVSRVPVVDNGKLVGVVGCLDMIKIRTSRHTMDGRGGKLQEKSVKEKVLHENVSIENAMQRPVFVEKETSLKDASKLFATREELFVKDGEAFYIVTPKDVIGLLAAKKEGVYVQINNLRDEDETTIEKMQQSAVEFVQKVGKATDRVHFFVLHIDRHHTGGKKIKYSVRARFGAPMGNFVSHAWGWDLVSVTQEAINKLEREVLKKHDILKERIKQKGRSRKEG